MFAVYTFFGAGLRCLAHPRDSGGPPEGGLQAEEGMLVGVPPFVAMGGSVLQTGY